MTTRLPEISSVTGKPWLLTWKCVRHRRETSADHFLVMWRDRHESVFRSGKQQKEMEPHTKPLISAAEEAKDQTLADGVKKMCS